MINWFEQYYQDFIGFATSLIRKHDVLTTPEDVVNDAYILFVESGEEFSEKVVKNLIYKLVFDEHKHHKTEYSFTSEPKTTESRPSGDKQCLCCHEVKNVNEFRVRSIGSRMFTTSICKKCIHKYQNEWFRSNKLKWNSYMKMWREKKGLFKNKKAQPIHDLWKKANKIYQQKQKDNLTDVYIRGLLKSGKKDFSPTAIEKKREELLLKRHSIQQVYENYDAIN